MLQASGGDYVQYLRASTNALSDGSTGQGSYIAVELQNPQFNATTGACTAYLAVYQFVTGFLRTARPGSDSRGLSFGGENEGAAGSKSPFVSSGQAFG